MAFIVYFFVLLVAASSVLFALDWVNAPVQPPAPAERTQVANSATQTKPEPVAQQSPLAATPSAPPRPTQGANSAMQTKPEPVAQQQPPAATPSAPPKPTQAANSAMQTKPEPVAQQQPPAATPSGPLRPTQAVNSATQSKPEPVAQQQPPPVTPSAPPRPIQAVNAQEQLSETERPRAAAAHAKRKLSRRTSAQSAASARAQSLPRADRRETESAPSWAIRGAEAARREAEQNPHRASVQPGPFRPFWEREGGWHFR
jgi:hypothetical protein